MQRKPDAGRESRRDTESSREEASLHVLSRIRRGNRRVGNGDVRKRDAGGRGAARPGRLTLDARQVDNGQIPKCLEPTHTEVDFWYTGFIDATLTWLIAIRFVDAHLAGEHLAECLSETIATAITWLQCQERPLLYLAQQHEASDSQRSRL